MAGHDPLCIFRLTLLAVATLAAATAGRSGVLQAGTAAPEPVCPGCTSVFYAGLNGSKCFRIPTIIKTAGGTLLAFAENRETDCGDNGAHHTLVVRRSHDDGASWGPMITVVKGEVPCPGCPAAISNPNPVEVLLADGKRAVLLHYDTMNNPSAARHGLDMQLWSHDEGLTWSRGTVLSYPPTENVGALIGPSVGIQSAAGIIYFSMVFGEQHWLYWSKDLGATWASSTPVTGLGECSIAFLVSAADGRIIMNCRTGKGHRAQLEWSADGVPGNVTFPPGLIDPGCQGSIVNAGGILHTSNANTTHSRSHMTVKTSVDQGKSWSRGVLVWSGPAGYSQLVPLSDQPGEPLGLLFEAGARSTYETISFAKVSPK